MSFADSSLSRPSIDPVSLLGRRFGGGKYRLEELLGHGGFGAAYLAEHLAGEDRPLRTVVVKVLGLWSPPGWSATSALSEARLAMAVFDQASDWQEAIHLVPVLDAGIEAVSEEREVVYLVCPLVRGSTLSSLIGRERFWDEDRLVRWMTQLAAGLAVLHACNPPLLHRDVKPDNVFVTPGGVVKLGDLGLASIIDPTLRGLPPAGAISYLAPEALLLERCRPPSDVYSAGIVFFEMATGESPLQTGQLIQAAGQGLENSDVRTDQVEARRRLRAREQLVRARPDLCEALVGVISRCLAYLPSERFPDAVCLYQEMLAIAREKGIETTSSLAAEGARAALEPVVEDIEVARVRRLLEAGRVKEAVQAAQELVAKRSDDVRANLALARALEEDGRAKDALELLAALDRSRANMARPDRQSLCERIVELAAELGYKAVVDAYRKKLEAMQGGGGGG